MSVFDFLMSFLTQPTPVYRTTSRQKHGELQKRNRSNGECYADNQEERRDFGQVGPRFGRVWGWPQQAISGVLEKSNYSIDPNVS